MNAKTELLFNVSLVICVTIVGYLTINVYIGQQGFTTENSEDGVLLEKLRNITGELEKQRSRSKALQALLSDFSRKESELNERLKEQTEREHWNGFRSYDRVVLEARKDIHRFWKSSLKGQIEQLKENNRCDYADKQCNREWANLLSLIDHFYKTGSEAYDTIKSDFKAFQELEVNVSHPEKSFADFDDYYDEHDHYGFDDFDEAA